MQGQLFSQDFLHRGIRETPPYEALSDAQFDAFRAALTSIHALLSSESTINEAQTEQLVIEKVLVELGWGDDYLPQVNLSGKRREDVPDVLLFPDASAKAAALGEARDDKRYRHGLAILEAKRWLRPLDRGDAAEPQDPGAPSSQMLRYLSRVDVVADRAVKWGVLTNGAVWRLYWQDARSRAEEFFEIDVAAALGVSGLQMEFDAPAPEHALRLFFLMFHRAAFLTQSWDTSGRSFHAYARNEARVYEEKVAQDLGARVFADIFPALCQALAKGDLQAHRIVKGVGRAARLQYTRDYLDELREAALILLYRLLFLFYAEDRGLLPVKDERYHRYSVRRLREQVRDDIDSGYPLANKLDSLYRDLLGVFSIIDEGEDAIGIPAYNGGLFDRARSPLLVRSKVPDAIMAPIIDALSRRRSVTPTLGAGAGGRGAGGGWINYRDLSVAHLGGIYERLLEYTLEHEVAPKDTFENTPEIDRILARPASFARKVSGSYYTHDDLVRLILRESVGLLARERIEAFAGRVDKWKKKTALNPGDWDVLDTLDPASAILELKICDPAMGSGHFLVALVDDLADRVLESINTAEHLVSEQPWAAHLVEQGRPWQSPLVARIAHIRRSIKGAANEHGWAVTDAQLDDRHVVRRMILKKSVFGVDKNPMAVELAKTALWLHTFTVGAPLSFLDHHIKCGDSLHGERLPEVVRGIEALGMLFQRGELTRIEVAANSLAQVADLTDVDIAEARLSKHLADEAAQQVAPIHALLDFWRALRWKLPGWPVNSLRKLEKLGDKATVAALGEIFSPDRNLVALLAPAEPVEEEDYSMVKRELKPVELTPGEKLIAELRAIAARETFMHWWTAFPTVFDPTGRSGFDLVLGNPPWDRIKLQEVEWFAERDRGIAAQPRAADRKRMIEALETKKYGPDPLWLEYAKACERAEANARVLGKSGDYPLLGGGDVNLYSLFVERAQALTAADGLVALLTPSGIAADKGAAEFFRGISATGRLGALFDFENRQNPGGSYFPDVDSRFKFCTLIFGGEQRRFAASRCAFYLHDITEADDAERVLELSAEDFKRVNPNTGAAPIFRNRRDAEITMRIYREHPVLVDRKAVEEHRVWPINYVTMFHMTNDSHLFLTRAEVEKQGAQALPLYVGRMVHQYDHRHASVTVNEDNLHVAAFGATLNSSQKADPGVSPEPQYWVNAESLPADKRRQWALGFRDIARATDVRTMIAAIVPSMAAGNTLPLLDGLSAMNVALLLANLNALAFDFIARQKTQTTHLNWYILEQLPVIAPARFEANIGKTKIADFIRDQVLHLSYTAHDLAPFARDLGYEGAPFVWDDADRRARMVVLDALFMHLYGLSEDDAAWILDGFPIVRAQDEAAFGDYRTKTRILAVLREINEGRLVGP
ncbi:MAG: restriction endonuclease [Sulfuritalea sp.]|nr:restriction endonuclease [Sulfuritalea sp.]